MKNDADILSIAQDARDAGHPDATKIAREAVRLPPGTEDFQVIASVSGGKDSTALIMALREAEIPARYVFADTGWEAKETYAYLELLEERIGIRIDRVSAVPKSDTPPGDAYSAMVDRIRIRAGFPGRMQRFCTRELDHEAAGRKMIWDERRDDGNVAQHYPLNTFEMGAVASSEY